MEELERLAKRFVDAIQEWDQIATKMERIGQREMATFLSTVSSEMRRRGMPEERIQNMLKGAEWGRQRYGEAAQEIKASKPIKLGEIGKPT
jgi:hypothetical protein